MNETSARGTTAAEVLLFASGWPRRTFIVTGAFATLLCLTALEVRMLWLGRPAFAYFVWNLFLAWVPLALQAVRGAWLELRALKWLAIPLDAAWLLFLPNAPYLVTDLIHLRERAPVPMWFDVLIFLGFAATGCWLGLVSLDAFLRRVPRGRAIRAVFAAAICGLCGYGVFLGRFYRFNSWDVLRDPLALLAPAQHVEALAFSSGLAVFFGAQLMVLRAVQRPAATASAPLPRRGASDRTHRP
jgi:uncharacterized membrane protein